MGADIGNPPQRARIKTGTYTGNGVDDRNIDIGVDLAAKRNPYVIIKGSEAVYGVHRIEYGQGDAYMHFANQADAADSIQAFTSTGFQVGQLANVNSDTKNYRYIAIWQEG